MTDLELFRDHARHMAAAIHRPDCVGTVVTRWGWRKAVRPDPACDGCCTEPDRTLWATLAGEIDDYLAADHHKDQPMLGEV